MYKAVSDRISGISKGASTEIWYMGIIKTWTELQEQAGQNVGSTVRDVAEGVASTACNLLAKYPNALPLAPLARGYVQGVCGDIDITPPEAEVPFTGGQCQGVQYTMVLSAMSQSRFGGEPVSRTINAITVTGVVLGVEFDDSQPVQDVPFTCTHTDGAVVQPYTWNLSSNQRLVPGTVSVEFVPADGSPDVCGDPPGSLPPDPPIDPSDFIQNITVNTYNDSGDVVTTNDYSIDFNDVDISQFDFALSVGGLDVSIDVGGINIGGGNPGEGGKTDRLIEDTGKKCRGGGGFDQQELEEEELEGEELVVEGEERLAWVTADIATPPRSSTTILHSNALDADYFAGYVVFTVSTDSGIYQLPPQSVKKIKSIFKAPDGATGFRAYPVNGAELKITAYYEKEEEES